MAKFCGNCGAPLDPGARACGRCGAFVEAPPASDMQPDLSPKPVQPKKQSNQKTLQIVLLAVLAVVVIAVLVSVIRYNSPGAVAARYFKATISDSARAARMTAYDAKALALYWYDGDEDDFFETQSLWLDEDISSWRSYYKATDASAKEYLTDEYGKYKITVEVKKVKAISAKKLRSDYEYAIDELEEQAGFNADKLKSAKCVTLRVTIKGEDDTERSTCDIILVRSGLSWKVLTTSA